MVSAVFNISIFFCLLFIYASAYFVFSYYLRQSALERWSAWRQNALQSARRGRQISDVTVSMDYRV